MVLLHSLHKYITGTDSKLAILHYNYRLHAHAGTAQNLVEETADRKELAIISAQCLHPDKLGNKRGGFEAEARDLRYEFFRSIARNESIKGIFLGHHRADQIETVLLNLGRGSGLSGLGGMDPVTTLNGLNVFRPFLDLPVESIKDYADDQDIDYIDDPTNSELKNARSRIRHGLLPRWRNAQPDPDSAIHNLSQRASRENKFWENYLPEQFRYWIWTNEVQVDREDFQDSEEAVQYRFLWFLLREFKGDTFGWSERNLDDLRDLFLDGRSGAKLSLPKDTQAINEYDRGCLYRTDRNLWQDRFQELKSSEDYNLPGIGSVNIGSFSQEPNKSEPITFHSRFPPRMLDKLQLRQWQKGDQYETQNGLRKLKKLFEDHSIPYRARRYWPLLTGDNFVRCVPGFLDSENVGDSSDPIGIIFQPENPMFHQLKMSRLETEDKLR